MISGTWRSADQPQALRAQAARAMLSEVHLPWSLNLPDRARYDCRLDWHGLGGCSVVECRSAPLSGYRDAADIRRTDGDYFGMLLVLSGEERVRQGDVEASLGAGDMLLWDGSRPVRFEVMSPLHKVTLLVPRERLVRGVVASEPRGAVRLESRSGLGALAAGHLASLAKVARDIPAGHAPLAADILVDLLGRLLDPIAQTPATGDLLSRILAHVEDDLDDPALTPSRIAARFGISPRYLHMLFSSTGETLSAHVRSRRLAAMRRDLADPRQAHRSITEIALAWGFCDSAHASRAFSAAFGQPPSAYRASRRQ
jgi:AraC-like DNA-binding protein